MKGLILPVQTMLPSPQALAPAASVRLHCSCHGLAVSSGKFVNLFLYRSQNNEARFLKNQETESLPLTVHFPHLKPKFQICPPDNVVWKNWWDYVCAEYHNF